MNFMYLVLVFLVIVLSAITAYLYINFRKLLHKHNKLLVKHKVRIKTLEKELLAKNKYVKDQLEEIMTQNIEITESIVYARKIQKVLLPPDSVFDRHFKEYFILFKPKQIVSGDFYWTFEKKNRLYLAAADCTGHGVPGAFMSLLGISFLNEILNEDSNQPAYEVLNKLRAHIVDSLKQTGKVGGSKDGMDMSLCVIDEEKKQLEFSGAYNPIFIIRESKNCNEKNNNCEKFNGKAFKVEQNDKFTFIHVKPDRMPVGFDYRNEGHSFSQEVIDLMPNDTIYMFSDGYADQFGGERNKKFSNSRLKKLLLAIQSETLEAQNYILDDKLDEWKGNYAQIDDILIIGIKIF